jgi:hypothetical protein
MDEIATSEELGLSLKLASTEVDVDRAELLLDLAQGLIVDEIGAQDPWPTAAKTVALAAAGRAYRNPQAYRRQASGPFSADYNAEEMGVYLTGSELERLHDWARRNGGTRGAPVGSFPASLPWPDPADRCV